MLCFRSIMFMSPAQLPGVYQIGEV
jgi:hypothetical protein